MARKDDIETVTRIREVLTAVGLRTTAARIAVMKWLESAKRPATHGEISDHLVPLGFDQATVFRNLGDLVDAGLAIRTELGDHVWRFELRDASHEDRGQHPHFVCIDCGSVTCLHEVDLPKEAQRTWNKIGQVTEILLRGHCKACS